MANANRWSDVAVVRSLAGNSATALENACATANEPASPEWDLLTKKLEEATMYEVYDGYGLGAVQQLALHDLALGKSIQGLMRVRDYLATPLPMQVRFEAKIVLLELLATVRDFAPNQQSFVLFPNR